MNNGPGNFKTSFLEAETITLFRKKYFFVDVFESRCRDREITLVYLGWPLTQFKTFLRGKSKERYLSPSPSLSFSLSGTVTGE